MIFAAREDGERAVNGFQREHPHHLVRESETRKGEPQIGPLLYAGRKAVRTADDQGQFALFPHDLGERGGQFFGGKHFPSTQRATTKA